VHPDEWVRLLALLDGSPDGDSLSRAKHLCALCVESTGVTGVAMVLASDGHHSTICATDPVSEHLVELEQTFTQGPGVDALRDGRVVQAPDLAGSARTTWPWYAPAAEEAGARAVFALPLQVGAIRVGVLGMYRDTTGGLRSDQLRTGGVLADAAGLLLTLGHAEHGEEAFRWVLGDGSRFRGEVHQAVGMTMVHLGVEARDAFARLCAHAYFTGKPIAEIAQMIVAKSLRLEPE